MRVQLIERTASAIAVLVVLVLSSACPNDRDGLVEEQFNVMSVTGTPGSSVVTPIIRTKRGLSATASWEVLAPSSWDQYRKALTRAPSGYHEAASSSGGLTLIRRTSGDVFTLQVDKLANSRPLRVRFTLTGLPD